MASGTGNHIRTLIPSNTYTFKWSVEHFSKFLPGKTLTSSDFYPLSKCGKWHSTLERSSSSITWAMHDNYGVDAHVHHDVTIVDSHGKVLAKKSLQNAYRSYGSICDLINGSDQTIALKLQKVRSEVVTFVCFMTLIENNVTSKCFDIQPDVVDTTENLKKLSNDLKTMYGVSLYTDVCLRIDDTVLRAHKAVLCARSPVFAKMFEHKMDEQETNKIEIADLEVGALKDLISYLYTGTVPDDNFVSLLGLYYAADKYDMADLRKTCGDMLLTKLQVDNVCRVLILADRHCDDNLKASIMTFMDIYLESIMATEGWSHMVRIETKLASEVMTIRAKKKEIREEKQILQDCAIIRSVQNDDLLCEDHEEIPPRKGIHVRTRIPSSTYTFKWSVKNFSKFLPGNTLTSSDFYPLSRNKWYSTLERSSSSITWTMHNSNGVDIHVQHNVSIVNSRGKVLAKKSLQKIYSRNNARFCLIDCSDQTMASEVEKKNDVMIFICFMTLTGNNITTDSFDLHPDVMHTTKNLKKLSNDLKMMYGVSLYTDMDLRVNDTILRAHKAILCGRSSVFAKMFEHKMDEQETNMIEITDLEVSDLKDLISYLYTGTVPDDNFESLFALYYAADKYDVAGLRKTCGDMLLTKLEVENVCRVLVLSDLHSDDHLKSSTMTFMDIYLESILATEGWSQIVNNETKLAAEVIRFRTENNQSREEAAIIEDHEECETIRYSSVPTATFFFRK